jgi:hypothetical protein
MMDLGHVRGFNHVLNATVAHPAARAEPAAHAAPQITISVLSVGLSSVYGGSRTLTALGESGYAPRIFTYVDKWCVRAHARLAERPGR